ncbi:MAG: hypothetical protein L0H91_01025, partial [Bifidobacterium mongoliense]|nr:hypothetical protein [Bifidobacterium mongoliense]
RRTMDVGHGIGLTSGRGHIPCIKVVEIVTHIPLPLSRAAPSRERRPITVLRTGAPERWVSAGRMTLTSIPSLARGDGRTAIKNPAGLTAGEKGEKKKGFNYRERLLFLTNFC